jgi:hypothetical protein
MGFDKEGFCGASLPTMLPIGQARSLLRKRTIQLLPLAEPYLTSMRRKME